MAPGGENIICFAKDWSETPTSNNHVMVELAKSNRVLWLNSIATRTPKLSSGRDVKKIFRKLASFARGAERVSDNMWVYTPIVLPLPHSRVATAVNQYILRMTLGLLRRKLGMKDFQLWTFLPSAADYVGKLGESVVVYYVVDEWSKFDYVDGARLAQSERKLLGRADVVFAAAQSLVRDRLALNPETHLSRHGVDHAAFAAALDETTKVPDDLAALPKPVLGFYGTLQNWVDFELLAHLARRHPDWSIALIGEPAADVSSLRKLPNVYFLSRKPHSELPNYCKGFSVGLIPYVLNERILHVNPLKLREYLSAGLPVVSVDLPEVQDYADRIHVARSYGDFEHGVEEALLKDTPQLRRQRSEGMRSETWSARVAHVSEKVLAVKRKKCGAG